MFVIFWLGSLDAFAWRGGVTQVDAWTSRDGLPQNSVTDIVQARDGYIWLTTFGGIARFDGLRFEVFTPAGHPGLPSTRYVSAAEGPDGVLWFGSEDGGIVRYDGEFTSADGAEIGVVFDLEVDPEGTVWAATSRGVWRVTSSGSERVQSESAVDLAFGPGGALWAAGGFARCLDGDCAAQPELVGGWYLAHGDAALFAVGGDRAFRLEPGGWSEIDVRIDGEPSRPFRWGGHVWVIARRALVSLDEPGLRVPAHFSRGSGVRAVLEDREEGLWVGTMGSGLSRVRRSGVDRLTAHSDIVAEAPDGGVVAWSCTGVEVAGADVALPEVPGCAVGQWADDGALWVLWGDEVVRWEDGVASSPVSTGIVDLANGAWMSDGASVFRPDQDRLVPVVTARELGEESVRLVRRDADGVWVMGTNSRILHRVVDGDAQAVGRVPGTASVRDVVGGEGGAWVATYGGGMHWLGEDVTRTLTMAHGLCDDSLSRILPTPDGYVWMNTNRGAGRIALDELTEAANGARDTVTCELLDSGEANGSSGFLRGDRLVLPTIRGAVAVDTRSALPPPVPPLVYIQEATYGQDAIEGGAVLYGSSDLSVRYTGLAFEDPVGLRFRHRLAGPIERPWTPLTADRLVRYVDLPPGDYSFEVQARSARGAWSTPISIEFQRAPAWWERTLVRVFAPLLGFGAILGLLVLRVRLTSRQNRELRNEVTQRLHAEQKLREQQAETERASRELEQSRRLEALGRLAGGVAHDFNNLLTVILGRMDLLRGHEDEGVAEDAEVVAAAAERAAALTAQLLAFGRPLLREAEVLDVGKVIQDLAELLKRLVGEMAVLHIDVQRDLSVRINRSHLEQIVINLAVNARDAMGESGGAVRIRAFPQAPDRVRIEVQDDGPGVSPEVAEQIFEPYFSTKAEGMGLGLATVHGLVRGAGGTIGFENQASGGTQFHVVLPVVSEGVAASDKVVPLVPLHIERSRAKPKRTLNGIRVLLVDDDEDVRRTMGMQLRMGGAIVEATGDPDAALARLGEQSFDVLVTDVLMPAMRGTELARRAREIRPIPVLFVSGHTGDALGFGDDVAVLRKPFTSAVLAQRVLSALELVLG